MVFGIDFKYFDWQNTFAPNDSYVHISNTELTEEEIEAEKQNIGTVKKVGLTDDAYQEHYRLLTVQICRPEQASTDEPTVQNLQVVQGD